MIGTCFLNQRLLNVAWQLEGRSVVNNTENQARPRRAQTRAADIGTRIRKLSAARRAVESTATTSARAAMASVRFASCARSAAELEVADAQADLGELEADLDAEAAFEADLAAEAAFEAGMFERVAAGRTSWGRHEGTA